MMMMNDECCGEERIDCTAVDMRRMSIMTCFRVYLSDAEVRRRLDYIAHIAISSI